MKRFTPDAIKNRMIERLRMSEDWALILQDGTVGNLIDTISEGEAELARYGEYLLGEKKWRTAMNFSSLQHQSDLIGYKRRLPQSAIGYIVVSHTDEDNQNRLANYGSYFFDIDAESNYDNLVREDTDSLEKQKALVPWTNTTPYIIPKGTRFLAKNGTEFISTKTVTSRVLSEKWKEISSDPEKLQRFYSSGGWNGIKYCKVPVIQGKQQTSTLGKTHNKRFESFVFHKTDIEDATNSISNEYFKVRLTKDHIEETWIEIDNIYRAGPYDRVFEKKILKDGSGILIKFGDGISGKLPPLDYTVNIDYLETLGAAGDIDAKYQITDMVFPNNTVPVDPRTNTNRKFLYCTNICAVKGGKDIEEQDEFKVNAPASYLKSYTIGTADLYLDKIMKYSPLSLLHCKVYPDKSITIRDANGLDFNTVGGELALISSNLQITAVQSNGDKILKDEADEAFIKPLLLSLSGQISPNDTFTYVEPNFIEFAPMIKVRTKNLSINNDEAEGLVKTIISDEYDIYNQDFNEPLYTSKIVDLASTFSWVDSVEVTNEALANVSFESNDILISTKKDDGPSTNMADALVAIPFSFDSIFGKNKYASGFRDASVKSDYLLKVDLTFKNGKPAIKNRTFFLLDNRVPNSNGEVSSVEVSKGLVIPGVDNQTTPLKNATTLFTNGFSVNHYEEIYEGNHYLDRQTRVAQYKYIDKITDTKFMSIAKKPGVEPSEIRPVICDENGSPKTFKTENVDAALRVPTVKGSSISEDAYKRNIDYIDRADIYFEEDSSITDDNTGKGYVILPLGYFDFDPSTLNMDDYTNDITKDNFMKVLEILLKEYVDIKVYAQPKSVNFEPKNPNDLCFIRKENIKVEKEVIY